MVFEGLDGAGTTTQSRLLAEALRTRDQRVRLTAEPSDGPLGRMLREHIRRERDLDPLTAALLFTADRADHLATTIRPALDQGAWVVCDRYLLSTLAYQGASGVDRSWILASSRLFAVPDLTVVLTVPEDVRMQRLRARPSTDRYEEPSFAEDLMASHAQAVDLLRSAGHRIVEIDASGAEQQTLEAVMAELDVGDHDGLYSS